MKILSELSLILKESPNKMLVLSKNKYSTKLPTTITIKITLKDQNFSSPLQMPGVRTQKAQFSKKKEAWVGPQHPALTHLENRWKKAQCHGL